MSIVLMVTIYCVPGILPVNAQFVQVGNKLVGTGAVWKSGQGSSVSLSSNGNTAVVGGPSDSAGGSIWVFSQISGRWAQQGSKLIARDPNGYPSLGAAVSISADGNTIIAGGYTDSGNVGAAWIFTDSGGVWSQQGNKLVGLPTSWNAYQGYAVAISADGHTAIVGGPGDNNYGAAWIFIQDSGLWKQQGTKLIGTGAVAPSSQGYSVAISADGNTAIVGGSDNSGTGAAWVFTRDSGIWRQQGSKLVGTGYVGQALQGSSVSLSADGNTALIGGPGDNGYGAVWFFVRNAGIWTQQGGKLTGRDSLPGGRDGYSVSLSSDGNIAIVGEEHDDHYTNSIFPYAAGAAVVYLRSAGIWTEVGDRLEGIGMVGNASQGWSVAISGNGSTLMIGGPRDNSSAGAVWVFIDTTSTAVIRQSIVRYSYQLSANYPNPFNPATNIRYSIPKESYVSIIIYDILGREVARLVQEVKLRGEYTVAWDATKVTSGVYYYRLVSGNYMQTRKMVLMK